MRIAKLILVLLLGLLVSFANSADKEMKVGFVYVTPIVDAVWSYSHDQGRKAVEELPGIKTSSSFFASEQIGMF